MQAFLAVVIQTPHWYPSLQWYHNECSILDEPNTLWTYKNASSHIQKGSWQVKWPCSSTVICALAMVSALEIKALNKATRKQGLRSSKRVLYQCRLAWSVEEVLSWHHHKNQFCQMHLIPHQPVVPAGLPRWCLLTCQASVTWWVYNECMNSINKPVVSNTLAWSPTSQWYLQASPADACLHDKLQSCCASTMNACLQWMHELRQQYSSQNSSALPSKRLS